MSAFNNQESEAGSFASIKAAIDANYPPGSYVAIAEGHVVAFAASFSELERLLHQQGRDPRDMLVTEAGAPHPECVTIFI